MRIYYSSAAKVQVVNFEALRVSWGVWIVRIFRVRVVTLWGFIWEHCRVRTGGAVGDCWGILWVRVMGLGMWGDGLSHRYRSGYFGLFVICSLFYCTFGRSVRWCRWIQDPASLFSFTSFSGPGPPNPRTYDPIPNFYFSWWIPPCCYFEPSTRIQAQ